MEKPASTLAILKLAGRPVISTTPGLQLTSQQSVRNATATATTTAQTVSCAGLTVNAIPIQIAMLPLMFELSGVAGFTVALTGLVVLDASVPRAAAPM